MTDVPTRTGTVVPEASAVVPEVVDERWLTIEKLLAGGLVLGIGLRIYLFSALTPGIIVALILSPLLIGSLRRYRLAVPLILLAGLGLISGLVLTGLSARHYRISEDQLYSITFYIGIFVSIAVLLWARTRLRSVTIAILFGVGSLVSGVLGDGVGSDNPWKFALAVPIAIVVLGVAAATRSRAVEIMMLIMLAGASVAFDSRSYMATFLLAAILVIWQLKPARLSRRGAGAWTAVLLALAGVTVYFLGTELLVGGLLGDEAQQRTIQQLDTAGNLVLGGRPELGAFLALLAYRPIGFGFGVLLDVTGLNVAKEGMAATGYDPENGYVERFMFGSGMELHSVIGDLWATTGIAGIAMAIMIAVIAITGVVRRVAAGTASGLYLFLICWTAWNLLFSPLISATPSLILLLGLSLTSRDHPVTEHC